MCQRVLIVAISSILTLNGCGTIDPQAQRCEQSLGDSYLPLTEHAKWRYSVDDVARDVPLGEKSNAVLETDGTSWKLEVKGATRPAVRWLTSDGSPYAWERNLYVDPETKQAASDQYYEPEALRFDASKTELGEWPEDPYTKTSIDISLCPDWSEELGLANLDVCPPESITVEEDISETWSVIAVDEAVDDVQEQLEGRTDGILDGDLKVLCQQRSCPTGGCINGTYCFAPGVGKVYELSTEREELTSVCFPATE